jgi:hypothetical protein
VRDDGTRVAIRQAYDESRPFKETLCSALAVLIRRVSLRSELV